MENIKSKCVERGGNKQGDLLKYGKCESTLTYSPKKTWPTPWKSAIYRDGLSKDQILGTHDIFVTSLHYGLIFNLSAPLRQGQLFSHLCRIHYDRITNVVF